MTDVVETRASKAVYSDFGLRIYDPFVLGFSNRFAWHCPTERLLQYYQRHVSGKHLDVGVGSGWFLDHCRFPVDCPEIHLLDSNPIALRYVERRLVRYQPVSHRSDIMQSFDIPVKFDSIGINYVLHCLPGNMSMKARAIANLTRLLAPSGTLFGATVLAKGVTMNLVARLLTMIYNRTGIFGNRHDDFEGLRRALTQSLPNVKLELVGNVALFAARRQPL